MMEVYVSSSCIKAKYIAESVRILFEAGFDRIELSGGTEYYPEVERDLLAFCRDGIKFLVHNYFPPPEEPFVINLASVDDSIRRKSVRHLERAINLSSSLGAGCFGFHAGFFLDFAAGEVGGTLSSKYLSDCRLAWELFLESVSQLKEVADKLGITLYVENNVLSASNGFSFSKRPFIGLDAEEIEEIREATGCGVLVDFAHLYVSSRTLNLDFESQVQRLAPLSEYWHLSGNDSLEDKNGEIRSYDSILQILASVPYRPNFLSLEVYDGLPALCRSYSAVVEGLSL